MSDPERSGEPDPRLVDPDGYFLERYGDIVVTYGGRELPLSSALQFEHLARTSEDIKNDPRERRANVFIGMLRDTGALDPVDDVTYPEDA